MGLFMFIVWFGHYWSSSALNQPYNINLTDGKPIMSHDFIGKPDFVNMASAAMPPFADSSLSSSTLMSQGLSPLLTNTVDFLCPTSSGYRAFEDVAFQQFTGHSNHTDPRYDYRIYSGCNIKNL